MGLKALIPVRVRKRCDVWRWRARYWWLDTPQGRQAHVAGICFGVLVIIVMLIRTYVAALQPLPPHAPRKALVWIIIELIILIIAAIIAYAMRPKPKVPAPAKGTAPVVDDGQSVRRHYGTVREDDSHLLAWKIVGTVPIKTSSGKK